MKSLINIKNASKIPYSIILFFLFLYVCPNIKYFGVGEMSYLPALIILFGYSFLSKTEFFSYLSIFFLCTIWPLYIFGSKAFFEYSSLAPFISLYIITIPVITSILLGRIIGLRFSYNNKITNQIEFKKTIIFLSLALLLSGILNKISPAILGIIIYTGRTSAGRWTFFFTEPSQAASVLLIFWFTTFHIIFRKNFYDFIGKYKNLFFLLIPTLTVLFTYLSLPTTLLAQIFVFLFLNFFIYFIASFRKIIPLIIEKFKILNNGKITKHKLFSILLLGFSIFPTYVLLYLKNDLLIYRITNYIIGAENVLLSFIYLGGFRVYYSFAALVSSLNSPLNLPGRWSGMFAPEMLAILEKFDLETSDSVLQLTKKVSVIKPLGWFYFSIYDLGFIGLIIFCLLFFNKYISYFLKGIIKVDFLAISLFSSQIALLIVPVLPSTPSVFFPLLIYSALSTYSMNKKNRVLSLSSIKN